MKNISKTLTYIKSIELTRKKLHNEKKFTKIEIKKHRKDYFGALKGIGKFSDKDRIESRV